MIRVIALGNPHRGDDAFMLALAEQVCGQDPRVELILAGRPGLGLLELLNTTKPVLLLDVVVSGAEPGTLHELALAELPLRPLASTSSHGQGPAEVLALALALGRVLPRGELLGIEAGHFELGRAPSPALLARRDTLAERLRERIDALDPTSTPCTSPDSSAA